MLGVQRAGNREINSPIAETSLSTRASRAASFSRLSSNWRLFLSDLEQIISSALLNHLCAQELLEIALEFFVVMHCLRPYRLGYYVKVFCEMKLGVVLELDAIFDLADEAFKMLRETFDLFGMFMQKSVNLAVVIEMNEFQI